jgi:hypothetical protein
MRATVLLLVVAAITSVAGVLLGARGRMAGLGAALGVVLEVMGATVLFFVANVAVGATVVLLARYASIFYTTLYDVADVSLLLISVVQALTITIWLRLK